MHEDVTRGIQREKTRESLAVMMAIASVIISLVVGNLTSASIGVALMLGLFAITWRYYSGPRSR